MDAAVSKLRIGIDIDNVISNFDQGLGRNYKKHDIRLNGITRLLKRDFWRLEFNWAKDYEEKYYLANIERIANGLAAKRGARKYIKKLSKNYQIYIITGRNNGDYSNHEKTTKQWLHKQKIYYDKLVFTNGYIPREKALACVKNRIAIMVDDSSAVCSECQKMGIQAIQFTDEKSFGGDDCRRAYSWKKLYVFIMSQFRNDKLSI